MPRRLVTAIIVVSGPLFAGIGCKAKEQYDTKIPHVQEFNVPPDQPRYSQAPEAEYKRRPPKDDFKPGPGAIDQGMSGQPVTPARR